MFIEIIDMYSDGYYSLATHGNVYTDGEIVQDDYLYIGKNKLNEIRKSTYVALVKANKILLFTKEKGEKLEKITKNIKKKSISFKE